MVTSRLSPGFPWFPWFSLVSPGFPGKLGADAVVCAAWVGDGTALYCTSAAAAEPRYFFLFATSLTLLVCDNGPGVSASSMISCCSCWWRLPEPVAGLADSARPT